MIRRFLGLALLAATLSGASGCCCCCGPFAQVCDKLHPGCVADDYRGGGSYYPDCGCGELYIDDWHNNPPRCEPCDQCTACWTGPGVPPPCCTLPPRAGSIMSGDGPEGGPMSEGPTPGYDMSSTRRSNSPSGNNSTIQR